MRSGDDRTLVRENRRRLCRAVGADPARTSSCFQVHGADIHRAAPVPAGGDFLSGAAEPPEGDGAAHRRAGRAIVVFAADCVPIVLARADGSAIAVCHAGWPGLVGRGRRGAALTLGDAPLVAAVGPCAGPGALRGATETSAARCARASATTSSATAAPTCRCAPSGRCGAAASPRSTSRASAPSRDAERFFSHRRDGARAAGRRSSPTARPRRWSIPPTSPPASPARARSSPRPRARAGRAPADVEIVARGQVRRRGRPAGAPRRRHPPRRARTAPTSSWPSRRRTATSSRGTSSATCRAARCATLVGRVELVHALESDSAAAQIEARAAAPQDVLVRGQHRRRPLQVRRRAGRPRRVPGAAGRPRARRRCGA